VAKGEAGEEWLSLQSSQWLIYYDMHIKSKIQHTLIDLTVQQKTSGQQPTACSYSPHDRRTKFPSGRSGLYSSCSFFGLSIWFMDHGARNETTSKRGRQKEKLTSSYVNMLILIDWYSKILHNSTPFGSHFLACSHFQLFLNLSSTSDFRRNLPAHAGGKLGKKRKGNGIGFCSLH
jgi:hypothetical protein